MEGHKCFYTALYNQCFLPIRMNYDDLQKLNKFISCFMLALILHVFFSLILLMFLFYVCFLCPNYSPSIYSPFMTFIVNMQT